MNREHRRTRIKESISKNKVDLAISLLSDFIEGSKEFEDESNQLLILASQLADLQKKENVGMLSLDKVITQKSRITYSLLNIVDVVFQEPSSEDSRILPKDIIEQIAQIPLNKLAYTIPTKEDIKNLVDEIGLSRPKRINPHLVLKKGDISYFFEEENERWFLELQLRSKLIVLDRAETKRQLIPTTGDLAFLSQEIESQMLKLWHDRNIET